MSLANMKFSELELPSNKKFGFSFVFIFGSIALYIYMIGSTAWIYLFLTSLAFLFISIINAEIFLPLNKFWMNLGLILGIVISPIILGIIFFFIFTPTAILMRLIGRDELKIKINQKSSHWIIRDNPNQSEPFKNQF